MGIGTSMGAYYDDEFHRAAAEWDPKYDDNIQSPTNDQMKDSSAEVSPQTLEDKNTFKPLITPVADKQTAEDYIKTGKLKITPEEIDTAMNLGMSFSGGGLSLAGVRAKTLDVGKLGTAAVMESLGEHPDDIWKATGMMRGADGQWRFEIPGKDAKLKESGFDKNYIPNDPRTGGEANVTYDVKPNQKLGDILDHPALYEAYPFLKDVNIAEHKNPSAIATANLSENRMSFNKDLDPEFLRGVLLHEAQHFIQAHEGFTGGASQSAFLKDSPEVAFTKYRRVQGEVEARNVQTRRDFTDEQRLNNTPRSTEDVPRFLQTESPGNQ